MKKSCLFSSLIAMMMVLSGCNFDFKNILSIFNREQQNNPTPAPTPSPTPTTPDTFVDPTTVIDINDVEIEEEEEEDDFTHKTCDDIVHGSVGGAFVETQIGRALEANSSYVFAFKPSTTLDTNYTVYSDDITVAQIQREAGSTGFIIKTILQGDAIITAYDSNEMLVLRTLIKVRNAKSPEACAKKLFNTPKFVGLYYGCTLSFTSADPLIGVSTSDDDFENTYIEFECKNCKKTAIFDDNFNYYFYDMELNQETSSTARAFTGMYVSVTLDIIMIYYNDGLYDMFLFQ